MAKKGTAGFQWVSYLALLQKEKKGSLSEIHLLLLLGEALEGSPWELKARGARRLSGEAGTGYCFTLRRSNGEEFPEISTMIHPQHLLFLFKSNKQTRKARNSHCQWTGKEGKPHPLHMQVVFRIEKTVPPHRRTRECHRLVPHQPWTQSRSWGLWCLHSHSPPTPCPRSCHQPALCQLESHLPSRYHHGACGHPTSEKHQVSPLFKVEFRVYLNSRCDKK